MCNCKALGYTGLFSLHIERPSYNNDINLYIILTIESLLLVKLPSYVN